MASKQATAKEAQGFTKESPKCANCQHFTSVKEEFKRPWSTRTWISETSLRCSQGGFKVGKMDWCKLHLRK